MRRIIFLGWLFLLLGNHGLVAQNEVLFQGFYWSVPVSFAADGSYNGNWYDELGQRAEELSATGFTAVWFPPPQKDAALQGLPKGGQGYEPYDYYDLGVYWQKGTTETRYGSLEELRRAIESCHAHRLKVMADLVLNHRGGGNSDGQGDWTVFRPASGRLPMNRTDFNPYFDNRPDEGKFGGFPDVAHRNSVVLQDLKTWVQWLQTIGFDGWRFDYARGYGGWVVKEICLATASPMAVGEYWTDLDPHNPNPHRQQLCDWINQTGTQAHAFDFTTKGLLHKALTEHFQFIVKDGKPAGLIGWWPGKAVTFIENHDTDLHWTFPAYKEAMGYAYILTHEGTPCVFWKDFYLKGEGLQKQIKTLISLRRSFAAGSTTICWVNQTQYIARREGQAGIPGLVVFINNQADPGTQWIQTPWPNTKIREYTHGGTLTTDAQGCALLRAPSWGYAIWAPASAE